jgi:peptidase E
MSERAVSEVGSSGTADAPRPAQIVAMGGVSFDPKFGAFPLLRYTLGLTGKARPMVCLIPTAGGEKPEGIINFYAASVPLDFIPTHLSLFSPPSADLRAFLLAQDLIFVGGGNTKSMLALWREWEVDRILREAWRQGIVLAGGSAGSICWFEQGTTDSIPGPLTPLDCLGFLPGSHSPHYDSEPERRPTYHRLLADGRIKPGYAADDAVGLHFVGERLYKAVSARPTAKAYHLDLVGGEVRETPIAPEPLPADD